MKTQRILLILLLIVSAPVLQSFCGFYVAKAGASLWNKSSAVIIARKGEQTVVTMMSDFKGDAKDFALVIPVPEVIKEEQIRIADANIFQKMDDYSAPRLVEYHDPNPCYQPRYSYMESAAPSMKSVMADDATEDRESAAPDLKVTVLERFTVGEYDMLVLSAEESKGLKIWLTQNGYQMPENAEEILEPYLKSDMKFFVAKVNLENFQQGGFQELRPIQMTFRSGKFMLPIRLGMANAKGDQDLIIYAISDMGRIETANYRTVKIPTDQQVPLFVKERFDGFYVDLFDHAWKKEGKNAVHLEYAWDLSSSNFVKCDPCNTTPPTYTELREAGAFWVTSGGDRSWGGADYQGNVFFTRLHVRYGRATFPQDLMFIATPNKEHFQGRYILTHPAQGDLSCTEGKNYRQTLLDRRKQEWKNLVALTGKDLTDQDAYLYAEPVGIQMKPKAPKPRFIEPLPAKDSTERGSVPLFLPIPPEQGPGAPDSRPWVKWVFAATLLAAFGFGVQLFRPKKPQFQS